MLVEDEDQAEFTNEEPIQEKRSFLNKIKNGVVTFARYTAASILSTCQYVSSTGSLLVNLEGKLVNFAHSKNPVVNNTITGIATTSNLIVTSLTRVPANFKLLLAKPEKDKYADQETVPLKYKPITFKDLGWKGRIFYAINLPLSIASCIFGPINIYYFSYTVIIGLIHLVSKIYPGTSDQEISDDEIKQMGTVIAISVFMLLSRAINTVAYDLTIANKNALDIGKTLDDGELPGNWSTLLATALITLPSAVSVTLLAHNSTLKALEHIAEQLPFHVPFALLNIVTKISTVSATQGHVLKSAPSIHAIMNRTINRIQGNPPHETSDVNYTTAFKILFYVSSTLSVLTDGYSGAASVASLFKNPHSPLAMAAAITSGVSLSTCAFGLNRQGFFRTMNIQPVNNQTIDDIEAQHGLLDEDAFARNEIIEYAVPPRRPRIPANDIAAINDSNEDIAFSSPMDDFNPRR